MRILSLPSLCKPVGIAVAILVAVAFSPSQAKAECGDYVHVFKDAPADAGTTAPVQHAPCNGPNCTSKPATPATPLTAPVNDSEGSKPLAEASKSDADSNHVRELRSRDLALKLPASIPSSIFHPPRAA